MNAARGDPCQRRQSVKFQTFGRRKAGQNPARIRFACAPHGRLATTGRADGAEALFTPAAARPS